MEVATDQMADLLLRFTGEGIYGIDRNGCCTFANPACLELLGFESDAVLFASIAPMPPPPYLPISVDFAEAH